MPYERSRTIEKRFQKVITLIKKSQFNAGQLAFELGISRPTIQRVITELRRRGYHIRSVHDEHGWRYELIGEPGLSDKRS